ncbi:MAG: phosphatase PAP2 family protein [Bacteroidetes bacterium]|nr:MAG: phosphatase PAP2 family protein [Bacteroidota bacterium]RLD47143.1 MAG: phosphatase PAP2 family protein [Bacteroidota bacterium]RLD74529.1 MAG: phosphatase PAP2 family protein [Bacteroidota bacterium]RLD86851.1 MAG: phosphatase PAP2 family protein [Bacteroidota bacterium]HHL57839.1 phosphatase PAP2 family protein [Bacteroidota bacterium]
MPDFLLEADTQLFLLINGWHTTFFDAVMVYISAKLFWLPLYLLLAYLLIREYKKKALIALLFVAVLVALTDQVSVHLFKNVFERLRPCHDEELIPWIHLVNNHCGGTYGFVSSHATNVFGIVVFISGLLSMRYRWLVWVLPVWGLLVMYSRVYLGVHYPLDVLAGAVVGAFLGWIILKAYLFTEKKWLYRWN